MNYVEYVNFNKIYKNKAGDTIFTFKSDITKKIYFYKLDDLKLKFDNPTDHMFESVSLNFLPYENKKIKLATFFEYDHFLIKGDVIEFWIIIGIAILCASLIGFLTIRFIKKSGNAPDNVTIYSTTKAGNSGGHSRKIKRRVGADSIMVEEISLTTSNHFPRNSRGRANPRVSRGRKGSNSGSGYRKASDSFSGFDV